MKSTLKFKTIILSTIFLFYGNMAHAIALAIELIYDDQGLLVKEFSIETTKDFNNFSTHEAALLGLALGGKIVANQVSLLTKKDEQKINCFVQKNKDYAAKQNDMRHSNERLAAKIEQEKKVHDKYQHAAAANNVKIQELLIRLYQKQNDKE